MKITKELLKQIIKEEIQKTLTEQEDGTDQREPGAGITPSEEPNARARARLEQFKQKLTPEAYRDILQVNKSLAKFRKPGRKHKDFKELLRKVVSGEAIQNEDMLELDNFVQKERGVPNTEKEKAQLAVQTVLRKYYPLK
jgi:hypothetical protein